MSKRMLCIYSVWKVKTLQHQLLTSQKKRKLGENLYTEEAEEETPCEQTAENYLDRLQTLLLAYAMAGVAQPATSDPTFDAKNEAILGSDSTIYAIAPLDICMQYFYRAKRTAALIPASKRLQWLQTRDLEERSEWTSRFRESTATLGTIMKEVYQARDAHWIPPVVAEAPVGVTPGQASGSSQSLPSKMVLRKPVNGKQVAKVMKDGAALCAAFQRGACKTKGKCPQGAHRCGAILKKDRVCGASSHGAGQCRTLRSKQHPEGLPNLSGRNKARVATDNAACHWVLDEIQALAQRGGGSIRENPGNSLHWELPKEREMMQTGLWQDTTYAACCFAGARAKHQRLRHNIEEISRWPTLRCNHVHAPEEWAPFEVDGARVFPSKEEAEYTAPLAFSIAVSVSYWAVWTGHARLKLGRLPPVETTGHRAHWLYLDHRSLREWAMTPMAISLGLLLPDAKERSRVCQVVSVDAVIHEGSLPANHVYVDQGHHRRRLPITKWAPPCTPGVNCSTADWLAFYVTHIRETLWDNLSELQHKVLVSDTGGGPLPASCSTTCHRMPRRIIARRAVRPNQLAANPRRF